MKGERTRTIEFKSDMPIGQKPDAVAGIAYRLVTCGEELRIKEFTVQKFCVLVTVGLPPTLAPSNEEAYLEAVTANVAELIRQGHAARLLW